MSTAPSPAPPSGARVENLIHPSAILGRARKRCFAVSPDPEMHPGPLPVCYFLHAWGGNAQAYINHERILPQLQAAPMISVFPESFRRWMLNDHEGNRYEDYFFEELTSAVEEHFGERLDPSRQALCGFSMGGLTAFLYAVRHPERFPVLVCHAAAFDAPRRQGDPYAAQRQEGPLLMPTEAEHDAVWGPPGSEKRREYDPYRFVQAGLDDRLQIYLSVGSDDFPRMVQMNRSFHEALSDQGISHVYEERPGSHDMDFVADCLPSSLEFIRIHLGTGSGG